MLPARCRKPPCRNIDVKTVATGGTIASSGARSARPVRTAGMTPRVKMLRLKPGAPPEICQR